MPKVYSTLTKTRTNLPSLDAHIPRLRLDRNSSHSTVSSQQCKYNSRHKLHPLPQHSAICTPTLLLRRIRHILKPLIPRLRPSPQRGQTPRFHLHRRRHPNSNHRLPSLLREPVLDRPRQVPCQSRQRCSDGICGGFADCCGPCGDTGGFARCY